MVHTLLSSARSHASYHVKQSSSADDMLACQAAAKVISRDKISYSGSKCLQGDQGQWEGTQNLGSCFGLEWRRLYDLPFSETEFLKNPLNEDKPVKISRDGQELPPDIGQELIRLFEEGAERAGVPRPGDTSMLFASALHACISFLILPNLPKCCPIYLYIVLLAGVWAMHGHLIKCS